MSTKIQCSVGILTFNSAQTLPHALESVRDFAEVIICDGGSTDETVAIANAFGARVIAQEARFKFPDNRIADFAGVRNQTLSHATSPWFLYLDSDEYLGMESVTEIRATIEAGTPPTAFWIPRKYVVRGDVIDCASTYPTNKQIRFFHREAVTKFIKTIHERIDIKPESSIKTLHEPMFVPMTDDVISIRKKWHYYIELEVARRGEISVWQWLGICGSNAKISLLYGFRFLKNFFFCRGKHLPWALEWERHQYHIDTCRRFWRCVQISRK